MKRSADVTMTVAVATACFIPLGIVFVVLPSGWNILPLAGIGLVALVASNRIRAMASTATADTTDAAPGAPSLKPTSPRETPAPKRRKKVPADVARRANRAFGPIVAGIIIDVVDLATFGPIGLVLGLPVGGLAGYWMGNALGLSRKTSLWCALAAGIYCTIPGTELIPLATMVGAYVRFRESGRRDEPEGPSDGKPAD